MISGKHTSVTKETSRALNQLQKVRRKRHENAERRAEKRAQASASGLLDDADASSDEDGEIDDQYSSYAGDRDRHRDRDRDGDYAPGRGRSIDRSPERDRRNRRGRSSEGDRQDEDAEMDKLPPSTMDLNGARVSRYEMVEGMYKAGFVDAMVGELSILPLPIMPCSSRVGNDKESADVQVRTCD
jgi:RNA polymerase-associated protein RTF1